MRQLLLLIGLLAYCVCTATDMHLKHLDTGNGLSNNKVNSIYRDSDGFLWIGTTSGLCRYDGYLFKILYIDSPAEGPEYDNYVEELQEDAYGNLWVKTGGGYCIYNLRTEKFELDIPERLERLGIGKVAPERVMIDGDKNLWLFIEGKGVYNVSNDGKKVSKIDYEPFSSASITEIADTPYGVVIISDHGQLTIVDRATLKVTHTDNHIASGLRPDERYVFTLVNDRDGLGWIFSNEQMWLYDFAHNEWISHRLPNGGKNLQVKVLTQDHTGQIWLGRDHHGLEQVVKRNGGVEFREIPDTDGLNVNNTVTTIYEDAGGTLWVGTYKKGVSYYNPSAQKFALLPFPDVNCMLTTPSGDVWAGTDAAGLMKWSPSTGTITSYPDPADSGNPRAITTLHQTTDGTIYVGCFSRGLKAFRDGHFTRISAGTQLDNVYPWAIEDADNGALWIGALGGGLIYFDPATRQLTVYNKTNSGLASNYILTLAKADDGRLYIGTSNGVCVYNPTTQKISSLGAFDTGNVNELLFDSRGLLWIASQRGLSTYDTRRDKLHSVPLYPGSLRAPFVLGVAEDRGADIWATEGSNLINIKVKFDEKTGDFSTTSRSYDSRDGLQNSDFNQRSFAMLPSGELLVGGLYGINHFKPDGITLNRTLPKVMFTGFRVGNHEVAPGETIDGKVIIKGSLNRDGKVNLWPGNTTFTVTFATDNYVLPEKTTYYYKLEGFSNEWLQTQNSANSVTYTNLSPGHYRLLVRAVNSDGYESVSAAALDITIHPPFWATPWAILLYILLFIGAVYLVYRMIRNAERRKFNERRRQDALQKQEELNQLKFKFFTNVSHDLRTPLTLIVSPLENMMRDTKDEAQLRRLTLMHNNAQRLLNLVNQLLDFRKNEVAGLTLQATEGDIVSFIRSVCQSFTMFSERKNIGLEFHSSLPSLDVMFDEDKISKVIMNLLGNAFKFTPEGGKVDVSVEKTDTDIIIKVADTGIGIKDSDKPHIFERFYQAGENALQTTGMGNGIGLSLVKEYINVHNGSIRVEDNTGQGSVFIIEIPIVKNPHPLTVTIPESASDDENSAPALPAPDETPEAEIVPTPSQQPQNKKTVPQSIPSEKNDKPIALVADDSQDMLDFLKDGLSNEFHVVTACDGKAAMKLLQSIKPAIILTDLMMPEMDGIELCRTIKSDPDHSSTPIIILTAKHDVQAKVEGLTIGADDYVTKPFNIDLLLLRMKKLISLTRKGAGRSLIDPEPERIKITSLDEKMVEKAVKYVVANIKRPELSVEELSSHLGMSRVHLYKKLKAITGKTPVEFIRLIRLKRGAQMLRESQLNVSEIAYQLGYNNPKYFSKYFKEEFGILPSVYQEQEERTTNYPV